MDNIKRNIRVKKRSYTAAQTEIKELLKKSPSEKTVQMLENSYAAFVKITDTVLALNEKLFEAIPDDMEEEEQKKVEEEVGSQEENFRKFVLDCRNAIDSYKAKLNPSVAGRDSLIPLNLNQSATFTSSPQLPKIKLPEFDGNIRSFISFKNLFVNLVHSNSEFSKVQKLYYLKSVLVKDAANFIKDFDIDEKSYDLAWEALLKRYENSRAIVRTHFRDLMDLKQMSKQEELSEFVAKFDSSVKGLFACGYQIGLNKLDAMSPFLAYFISSKLDFRTKNAWEDLIANQASPPSYQEIIEFLQNRVFSIEDRKYEKTNSSTLQSHKSENEKSKFKKSFNVSTTSSSSPKKCVACEAVHFLNQCPEFRAKNPLERFEIVKSNQLCNRCFSKEHKMSECSYKQCAKCNGNHHVMLHRENSNNSSKEKSEKTSSLLESSNKAENKYSNHISVKADKTVILPTAVVKILVGNRRFKLARILLDVASQATLVSESFIKNNNISVEKSNVSVVGISDDAIKSSYASSLTLQSRLNEFEIKIDADVVPYIPYSVDLSISKKIKEHYDTLKFADEKLPHNRVDILLGSEYVEKCYKDYRLSFENLTIRNSFFGYIVNGACQKINRREVFCNLTTKTIGNQLERFWSLEEIEKTTIKPSSDMEVCNKLVEETLHRDENNRFVASLPFKADRSVLGESYNRAKFVLLKSEKKLAPEVKSQYVDFMEEYINLGHMKKSQPTKTHGSYYIPHQAVVRPSSTTTQLRVVFNASSKTSSGYSLNDILHIGPKTQRDLFDILLNFRNHKFVFTADVEKMYRQVNIAENDRSVQKILWRKSPLEKIEEYELCTVTYGTGPASFLATKCLQVISKELEIENPIASSMVLNDFYMDDIITGHDDLATLIEIRQIVHDKLLESHFPLRKYLSNTQELLDQLSLSEVNKSFQLDFAEDSVSNVLGIGWKPKSDVFVINIKLTNLPNKITKRIALSESSKIFDPLGLLSPIVLNFKIFLQKLWSQQIPWDSELGDELSSEFIEFYKSLECLNGLSFNRAYTSFLKNSSDMLVGFADASPIAYCAVVYIRRQVGETVETYIVSSKTKVAPIERPTIPRSELIAANMLADLLERIRNTLAIPAKNVLAFTDSTIVLGWLKQDTVTQWKTFISNRVQKIVTKIPPDRWYYVRSAENPADLGTRGVTVPDFVKSEIWTLGPEFVRKSEIDFSQHNIVINYSELPERNVSSQIVKSVNVVKKGHSLSDISSYCRLLNVVAYILRFYKNCKLPMNSRKFDKFLDVTEKRSAFGVLIRYSQKLSFENEMNILIGTSKCTKKGLFFNLCPYVERETGLVRVGGRLQNSPYSAELKNPIIWSANSFVFVSYIKYVHEKYYHANRTFVVNFVKSTFYVINGLNRVVKAILSKCVICCRFKGVGKTQLMGNLPTERISYTRPFKFVGVDFAGPFERKPDIRTRSSTELKVYASVFVCLVTRCVHLEAVSNLSTQGFLDALRRFIARRGKPEKIWSDNATNFTGARNEIDQHKSELMELASNETIKWEFIPPRSPHKGGLWEAAVKSFKSHFYKVVRNYKLTYEDYSTIFAQIESLLNSRPLSYRQKTDTSFEIITPSHFIVGKPLIEEAFVRTEEAPPAKFDSFKAWRINQNIRNSFWSQWKNDYLQDLQLRSKWSESQPNLKVNQLVFVKDENSPPLDWNVAKIVEVYPDSCGMVRVVDLLVQGSIKRRSINRLIPLPENEPQIVVHPGEHVVHS